MKTVVRAYLKNQKGVLVRTLLDSDGKVYLPKLKQWVDGAVEATVPGHFESWADVPASWVGHVPFWR